MSNYANWLKNIWIVLPSDWKRNVCENCAKWLGEKKFGYYYDWLLKNFVPSDW